MFLPPPHLLLALSLNLANSVKCRSVEPSCLMIKWSDLQPAPAWERQGSDFNPSTCSAGLIKMNFLQATTLPTGQESSYIRNPLLRYCIKFIVGRHRRTLRFIYLLHFFFLSLLSFPFLSTFLLWSSLWNPSLHWQRLPYENGWSFYGALPIYYFLGLVYLRGRDREREMEGSKRWKKKKNEMRDRGGRKERGCLFQTVDLINIHQWVFHNFKQKGTKPTQGQHRQGWQGQGKQAVNMLAA